MEKSVTRLSQAITEVTLKTRTLDAGIADHEKSKPMMEKNTKQSKKTCMENIILLYYLIRQ
jgi:hypothetical protein